MPALLGTLSDHRFHPSSPESWDSCLAILRILEVYLKRAVFANEPVFLGVRGHDTNPPRSTHEQSCPKWRSAWWFQEGGAFERVLKCAVVLLIGTQFVAPARSFETTCHKINVFLYHCCTDCQEDVLSDAAFFFGPQRCDNVKISS